MKYATLCSGIEAPTVAWKSLGWQAQWFSEIAPFPSAVLQYHYPNTPNLGDMTQIHQHEKFKASEGAIDLICGGTPCQSFSIAGLRSGLDDPRGNLALVFLRIIDTIRPRWVVWENVPGVLSSSGGRDFGTFLGGLEEIGYGWAYRVLDAQYFGLAQRRERVFVIGYLGDWRPPAAVLFERQSLRRSAPPRRKAGSGFAADLAPCLRGQGPGMERVGDSRGKDPIVAVARTLTTKYNRFDPTAENYVLDVAPTLCAGKRSAGSVTQQDAMNGSVVVVNDRNITSPHNRSNPREGDPSPTLTAQNVGYLVTTRSPRRLTPVEAERLQGFPDNYTKIPYRNRPAHKCADGPRYRAIGNSIAKDVILWLGKRIEIVDKIIG